MCLIQANATFDATLNSLGQSDRDMIERRLFEFAAGANVNSPGGLDNSACLVKRFPPELSGVRKITIGRHRVFYKGHHKQCSYFSFAIKPFKKTGVNDEDDPKFQKLLARALAVPAKRQIQKP